MNPSAGQVEQTAQRVREALPPGGLFAEQTWRIALEPFPLGPRLAGELERLGRVLLQFKRAANLLYRQSAAGKQPAWAAEWLDRGKPRGLIDLQRDSAFKHDLPRVIRPDILLTEEGFSITELDAVPGGIGLTDWLNHTYAALDAAPVMGGPDGMRLGFARIFGDAKRIHIVVSREADAYRPEMAWLARRLPEQSVWVRDGDFADPSPGDAVYRFFELFDLANVPGATHLFELARRGAIRLTAPPKPALEEKLMFGLLWNRNLREFWRRELGENFLNRMLAHVPYTWVIDPAPLPPHGAIPELNLTDWRQLHGLSQKERALILKASGFSEHAWGARSVSLGSDLSAGDWSAAVDHALRSFDQSPYILQRYHKPRVVSARWYDFERRQTVTMEGRVRLCPYYFVTGDGDAARANLGGVLATICPADKKIIHGMRDAILAPCTA